MTANGPNEPPGGPDENVVLDETARLRFHCGNGAGEPNGNRNLEV